MDIQLRTIDFMWSGAPKISVVGSTIDFYLSHSLARYLK